MLLIAEDVGGMVWTVWRRLPADRKQASEIARRQEDDNPLAGLLLPDCATARRRRSRRHRSVRQIDDDNGARRLGLMKL
jgi:hypothetical protein